MPHWKTDDELADIAERTAEKLRAAGYEEDLRTVAAEFTTLDPAALAGEYEQVKVIARASTPRGLDEVPGLLAGWHGAASEEFARQVTRIGSFLDSQRDHLGRAAQGIDCAYIANVVARQSFHDLCAAAIEACDAATGARTVVISALTEIPSAVFGVAVGESLTVTVGVVHPIGEQSGDPLTLCGTAAEVATGFGTYLGDLLDSYAASLDGAARKLDEAAAAMRADEVRLLDPLPARYTDPHSPEFSYANFFSAERDKDSFGSIVDRAAKATAADTDELESDIMRALDGDGRKPGD